MAQGAPNALSSALRRMASNLLAVGIESQFNRADVRGRHMVSLWCFRSFEKIVSSLILCKTCIIKLRSRVMTDYFRSTSKVPVDSMSSVRV
jgi:hypothetical protein